MVSRETLISEYFPERGQEALRYGEILGSWGIERGLIGPREGERIWDRHIANCLPLTKLLPKGVSLIDIGSGAGLPGIVLALARPDIKITLLEPLERRVNFLEEVKSELGIAFEVKRGKAEGAKGQFDLVTGRAVAALPKFLSISWHLVKPGGSILAMKGASAQEEIDLLKVEKLPKDLAKIQLHEITLGELELARIVELAKAG